MSLEAEEISFQYERGESSSYSFGWRRGKSSPPVPDVRSGSRKILNKVSLGLDAGDRLGLTAPSGFGKTTFCKILSGYERPDTGRVLLDGRPLSDYKGYCPVQMIWQHPELSVNPMLNMKEILSDAGKIPTYVIEGLGIELDWMSRYPSELSGGELQRFCIARALGERTRYLLADEMSAMLDLITQSQLWEFLLAEVKKRGIGLLVVSHWDGLLDQVCNRRIRLEDLTDTEKGVIVWT